MPKLGQTFVKETELKPKARKFLDFILRANISYANISYALFSVKNIFQKWLEAIAKWKRRPEEDVPIDSTLVNAEIDLTLLENFFPNKGELWIWTSITVISLSKFLLYLGSWLVEA